MFTKENYISVVLELIRKASQELPEDVINALQKAKDKEPENSNSYNILNQILQNVFLAKEQHTGN